MDFTLDKYEQLLEALKAAGYVFLTMEEYADALQQQTELPERVAIMRHDVDLKAVNSLRTAQIENRLGVCATYYFRVVRESNQPTIIRDIVALGHEIGYHYEDMAISNGDVDKAYEHFCLKLGYFRSLYPVKTICMHGAPTSRYDGRDLWKKYDYREQGIICEPYLDLDYSRLFYLTDTGRRWDGYNVSLRDKIPVYQDRWIADGLVFRHTDAILQALHENRFPSQVLFTTHPQRWNKSKVAWTGELLKQVTKNVVKRGLIIVRKVNK